MFIRSYKSGDEQAILSLFHECFKKEMAYEFWHWRFINNPANQNIIQLAWEDDILAAHYAVSPTMVCIGGYDE